MIRVWRAVDPRAAEDGASIPILPAPPSSRSLERYARAGSEAATATSPAQPRPCTPDSPSDPQPHPSKAVSFQGNAVPGLQDSKSSYARMRKVIRDRCHLCATVA